MTATDNELMASITRTVPALLTTMEAFEQVQADMHPQHIAQMGAALQPFEAKLQAAFGEFSEIEFPEDIAQVGTTISDASRHCLRACDGLTSERGGFSAYIPEYLDPSTPVSVVIALHGGTGHGADFLWSWLREAQTRGFILVAPTSVQDTWSLMGDEQHILLTGMSDGATYSLMAASQPDSPFTHLAPFSGVLHPDLVLQGRVQHLKDKPIYLVYGTEDWMFPVESAHMAQAELTQIGAHLTYREIPGLSHHFARGECPAVLQWFNAALAEPSATSNTQ
jgi:phospholipase/carboxylesterase